MKKKLIVKLMCLAIVLLSFTVLLPNVSNAWDYKTEISASWTDNIDGDVEKTTQNIVGTAINVIRIVGTGVAIIMITYVAIKYMSAAPAEKAEFKKSAIAYIVGAIVLFAATNIINVIANFATTNI